MIFQVVVWCAVLAAVGASPLCLDWGDDKVACSRMKPATADKMTEMSDKDYYRIVPNSMTFYPGQKVHVRVLGKNVNDRYTYSGVFMAVTEAGMMEKVVGTWGAMHPSKYRRLPCYGMENVAIAEANETMYPIMVQDDVFIWNAPDSCEPGMQYDLKATVISPKEEKILSGLSVRLQCVAKKMKMMMPNNACAANYTAGLMETSWETDFGGWWNDPMATLRWTRKTGPTPSSFTGPKKALKGEYYIYTEGSYPAKEGDIAILNSPPGLNGCFCVRLKCHMWVGKGSYFDVRVNGEVQWVHDQSADVWQQGWQSVNDANYPQIQFVMHRGVDFRADITIDDLEIVPGLCPEDVDDDVSYVQPVWENVKN